MTTPVFDFTDRCRPVVQFGRSQQQGSGATRWGRSAWGDAYWSHLEWTPIWADATCDIHEVTTNTGRGSASDRFVPGTADIIASNADGLSSLIFPELPPPIPFEFVPQPPIPPEEELQADMAATVTTDGWRFTDDFERTGPQWVFPTGWNTGTAPTGAVQTGITPMKFIDGALEPELYADGRAGHLFIGNSAAQWTLEHPADAFPLSIEVTVQGMSMPGPVTAGEPHSTIELYAAMNTIDRACMCARITYTPAWSGGDNTIICDLFKMGPTGSRVSGIGTPVTLNLGATEGVFSEPVRWRFDSEYTGVQRLYRDDVQVATYNAGGATLSGGRAGVFLGYQHGDPAGPGPIPGPVKITQVLIGDPPLVEDIPIGAGDLGPGWTAGPFQHWEVVGQVVPRHGGGIVPEQFDTSFSGVYRGDTAMQWVSEFDADTYQFVEITISGMSQALTGFGFGRTYFELICHWDAEANTYPAAYVDYLPDWAGDDNTIQWGFYSGSGDGGSESGEINLGPTEGQFPEPAVWRFEVDPDGTARLYYNGALLGTDTFPLSELAGTKVGFYESWDAGPPGAGVVRPRAARIEQLAAGVRQPPVAEQLGAWVRVGVDHVDLGRHWFFTGFVDGMVPTYLPDVEDAVRIECVDSLAEAGRVFVPEIRQPHQFATAPVRIRQVFDGAGWPKNLRVINDDSTVMSRPGDGKAVDLLTHIAESCGGAVYGDPMTGDVVFKGQDWQAEAASAPVDAFIANHEPEDERPVACPVGWEMSSRRSDMVTRIRYETFASTLPDNRPLIKEWRAVQAEALYGTELYERTLLCTTAERVNELCFRQLRLRNPRQFPRVEAVMLDAATSDDAMTVMTTANFTTPSHYQCSLRRDEEFVFTRKYLVTGIRHVMARDRWQCRLALDIGDVFIAVGDRWGEGRWGTAHWGNTRG